jgi:hypothetical protein
VARRGRIIGGLAALGLVAGGGYAATQLGYGPLAVPDDCRAVVGGHTVEIDTEQAENASLIAAIGTRRGFPARAVSIALATAYQESKIRNITYGDRDSLGLFQQRPSQGWGTEEEILDPRHAINAFYDELQKVDGYESMRITEAAQKVQRSGHPEGYEKHADNARALASALTGHSGDGQFSCEVHHDLDDEPDRLDDEGLTGRAAAVRRDILATFGDLPMGGFEPKGVSTGHKDGSAHYEGRAVDVFFRPVNAESRRQGWALAYYLVAQAERLGVETVIFDDMIWTAGHRSDSGWRDYEEPDRPGDKAVLRHLDHVHVDVVD